MITLFTIAAIAVSRDHKPDQSDERQRIEDAGGFVLWAGKAEFFWYLFIILLFKFHEVPLIKCNYRDMAGGWRACCFSCIW